MTDALKNLTHDHAELNRRVFEIGTALRGRTNPRELVPLLSSLRDLLFLHFAREEEGLIPFVAAAIPSLVPQVDAMVVAHDTICGTLSRIVHLASSGGEHVALMSLFERFERAYAQHANIEADLLQRIDAQLDQDQRARLAELIAGI